MGGELVVLVHGLWMNGSEFALLGHRLRREHGFDVRVFKYSSLRGDFAATCERLGRFVRGSGAGRVHLIAHSLGGAFAHRMLEEDPSTVSGHVVLLASPLGGSRAAEGVRHWPMLSQLVGPHVLRELANSHLRQWPSRSAAGAIAGTRAIGTGQFFAHFDEDNDGTVAVRETRIAGLADHIVLPHSHMGMLFATDVAEQTAHFLRHARFRHDATPEH
jgi:pimeloyl-ACP methyl ester carboxylesterase